ncbi:hypothetical protein ACWGQ5_46670 [Streptomyces sp. NPDC055722]
MAETDTYLRAELNVEWPESEAYRDLAVAWLDGGFSALAGDHRKALEEGPKLPAAALRRHIPCGPAGAAWGFVQITRQTDRGSKRSARVISPRAMTWFLNEFADPPIYAEIGLSVLDKHGYPGASPLRISLERPLGDDGEPINWAVLAFRVPEATLLAPRDQERWLHFLHAVSQDLNPSFGNITYYDLLGKTGIERTIGPPWRLPDETIPMSRQRLRGYEWWTICPQELADCLGGVEGLIATRAFHDVVQLPAGGVWLQATERYADYDEAAHTAVFRALAPVLPEEPA